MSQTALAFAPERDCLRGQQGAGQGLGRLSVMRPQISPVSASGTWLVGFDVTAVSLLAAERGAWVVCDDRRRSVARLLARRIRETPLGEAGGSAQAAIGRIQTAAKILPRRDRDSVAALDRLEAGRGAARGGAARPGERLSPLRWPSGLRSTRRSRPRWTGCSRSPRALWIAGSYGGGAHNLWHALTEREGGRRLSLRRAARPAAGGKSRRRGVAAGLARARDRCGGAVRPARRHHDDQPDPDRPIQLRVAVAFDELAMAL